LQNHRARHTVVFHGKPRRAGWFRRTFFGESSYFAPGWQDNDRPRLFNLGPLSREVSFLTEFQRPSTLLRPAASRQIRNFNSARDSPQPRPSDGRAWTSTSVPRRPPSRVPLKINPLV